MTALQVALRRSLRDLATPRAGETLLCALSGGPDSVALVHALALAAPRMGFRVSAAHLDHGLRPDSGQDAQFCRNLCERLGVSLHMGSADVRRRARRDGQGLESAAREERYAFLGGVALSQGAVAIAVAHTRDDQAETLLLRLLRGSGSVGLGAMRARRGRLIRPLLGVSRVQVLEHLASHSLTWREDPSNADLSLLRNRVRHELLPQLEARFNPNLRRTLARTAAILAEDAAFLGAQAKVLYRSSAESTPAGLSLELAELRNAPSALARHVLRLALKHAGGLRGVAAIHIERLLDLACSKTPSGRRVPLPGGREVRFRTNQMTIVRAALARPVVAAGVPA